MTGEARAQKSITDTFKSIIEALAEISNKKQIYTCIRVAYCGTIK